MSVASTRRDSDTYGHSPPRERDPSPPQCATGRVAPGSREVFSQFPGRAARPYPCVSPGSASLPSRILASTLSNPTDRGSRVGRLCVPVIPRDHGARRVLFPGCWTVRLTRPHRFVERLDDFRRWQMRLQELGGGRDSSSSSGIAPSRSGSSCSVSMTILPGSTATVPTFNSLAAPSHNDVSRPAEPRRGSPRAFGPQFPRPAATFQARELLITTL